MQIEERMVGDVVILSLIGKVTLGSGDEILRDKIRELIGQGRKKVLLNLEQAPYLDSVGNGEIVRCFTALIRQGGQLKMLKPARRIIDLWLITKLLSVYEIFDDEATALKSFI